MGRCRSGIAADEYCLRGTPVRRTIYGRYGMFTMSLLRRLWEWCYGHPVLFHASPYGSSPTRAQRRLYHVDTMDSTLPLWRRRHNNRHQNIPKTKSIILIKSKNIAKNPLSKSCVKMTQKPLKDPLKKQFLSGKNEAKAIFSKYFLLIFISLQLICVKMTQNNLLKMLFLIMNFNYSFNFVKTEKKKENIN